MTFILLYILKLSLSLGVVFLFYRFVLRKLTFYDWNRWFLLGYPLLCFFIPFIDISAVLEKNEWTTSNAVAWVPVITNYKVNEINEAPAFNHYNAWDSISLILLAGMLIMAIRFLFQLISFIRMRRKAKAIPGEGMNLYQVDKEIIPFSFGNSIFINQHLHTPNELQEIIHHEFIHVKQKHSIDIIWSELLCIINWYNPFVWLLKKSIRQNLEFIADNKVLENGINKKQYQYLLLKVIGNNQFSIAPKFNFSSLKKRIAMMNKSRTARLHLVRFLFILPLLAIVLVSFRKQIGDTLSRGKVSKEVFTGSRTGRDTLPSNVELNEKGYYFTVHGKNDKDGIVVIKDKDGKEVDRVSLAKWKENQKHYEDMYGELVPPPPPPPVPPVPPMPPVSSDDKNDQAKKAFLERNPEVKTIGWVYSNNGEEKIALAVIVKKDGTKEEYNLDDPGEKSNAEKKYGELPIPVPPSPPPPPPVPPTPPMKEGDVKINAVQKTNLSNVSNDFEITDKKAVINLKNGKTEVYDLTNQAQKKKFEDKYGKIVEVNMNVNSNVNDVMAPARTFAVRPVVIADNSSANSTFDVATVTRSSIENHVQVTNQIAPPPAKTIKNGPVMVMDDNANIITGKEDIVITITGKTTPDQLEEFKKQMEKKGVELKFNNTSYTKGILTHIAGTMKYKDSHASFSGTDFEKVILALMKEDDQVYFKVNVQNKEVI